MVSFFWFLFIGIYFGTTKLWMILIEILYKNGVLWSHQVNGWRNIHNTRYDVPKYIPNDWCKVKWNQKMTTFKNAWKKSKNFKTDFEEKWNLSLRNIFGVIITPIFDKKEYRARIRAVLQGDEKYFFYFFPLLFVTSWLQ